MKNICFKSNKAVDFDKSHDRLTRGPDLVGNEDSKPGVTLISGWIGQTYFDLSDPEIRKALMKNKPKNSEMLHKSIELR